MLIVADANPIISSLINKGETFRVFKENSILRRFDFISPEFMLVELNKNKDKLKGYTRLPKEELDEVLSFILQQIRLIPFSEFSDKLPEAIKLNFKDSPYLALALNLNCPIFSGDKELKKQSKVRVLSPKELLEMCAE